MQLTDELIKDIQRVMWNWFSLKIPEDVILQTVGDYLWDNMTCHTGKNPEFETTSRGIYMSDLTEKFSLKHNKWPCYGDGWTRQQMQELHDEIQAGIDAFHKEISGS